MRVLALSLFSGLLMAALPSLSGEPASAQPSETVEAETRQSSWFGQAFAMEGQDVVSFFQTEGPVEGSPEYTVEWDNTEWRFSSAENRDLFAADPEQFAPQFGGYCPVALARGELLVGSAQHHVVVDDKIYMNLDEGSANLFRNETGRFIAEAKINF